MDLYLDTYTWEIWNKPTRSRVLRFVFDRGATEPVRVRFATDGVVVALADGSAAGTLSFKTAPTDLSNLVAAVNWTKTGTGTSTIYTFLPSFLSGALDTLLGSNYSVTVYGEIHWTDGTSVGVAPMYPSVIRANVARGGESNPGVITSGSAIVLNGVIGLVGGTATDLDSVATVGLTANTGIPYLIRIGGQFIAVYLESGAADTADGEIAPLDYNVSTNAKKWTRGL